MAENGGRQTFPGANKKTVSAIRSGSWYSLGTARADSGRSSCISYGIWSLSPAKQTRWVPALQTHGGTRIEGYDYAVPPDGPYTVSLKAGEVALGEWKIEGMNPAHPWKAFSGKTGQELDLTDRLPAERHWFVLHRCAILDASSGAAGTFRETGRCHLTGDWYDYQAVCVDLASAGRINLRYADEIQSVLIASDELSASLSGGDLLQPAELRWTRFLVMAMPYQSFAWPEPRTFLRTK